MKTKMLCAIYLVFIFIISLSASFSGAISEIIYYSAFIIPISLGLYCLYSRSKNKKNFNNEIFSVFKLGRKEALISLPLFFPSIAVVCLISYLSAALMNSLGYDSSASPNEPFIIALALHALIPAILEELLFRLIPMKLFENEQKNAVLISSLFFAFAHANLFQIPYAFFAGIIFSFIYLLSGSIIPCIALHFLNNCISLISIYMGEDIITVSVVSVLTAVSLIGIIKNKKIYSDTVSSILNDKKTELHPSLFLFIFISIVLASSSVLPHN